MKHMATFHLDTWGLGVSFRPAYGAEVVADLHRHRGSNGGGYDTNDNFVARQHAAPSKDWLQMSPHTYRHRAVRTGHTTLMQTRRAATMAFGPSTSMPTRQGFRAGPSCTVPAGLVIAHHQHLVRILHMLIVRRSGWNFGPAKRALAG